MATVKILVTGYTSAEAAGKTCPTITLVQDKNLNIIVDPGVLDNQEQLVDSLKTAGLEVKDINLVFITHSHLDHYRNIGMFKDAKTLEYWGIWDGGLVIDWSEQLTENIRIIKTPGHSADSLTMLVKTDQGTIGICGDVFWQENLPAVDAYATDPEKLKLSRAQVLAMADFLVPGHGAMFKTN